MYHSGTNSQSDRIHHTKNRCFTLIRGHFRLSFLQYRPCSGHYALRSCLCYRRLGLGFPGGLRRASRLGPRRLTDLNVLFYGTDLSSDTALVVGRKPSVVLFSVYPVGNHVRGTCGVLLLRVYPQREHGIHDQRSFERQSGMAVFCGRILVFLPSVGEYRPAVRLLPCLSFRPFGGADELRRALGKCGTDGADFSDSLH